MCPYLFHPQYKEVRVGADGLEATTTGRENCYYHGKVLNTSSSTVAVDTCGGLRGMVIVDGKRFQVLPAATHFNLLAPEAVADADAGAEPHIIYSQGDVDAAHPEAHRLGKPPRYRCHLGCILPNASDIVADRTR